MLSKLPPRERQIVDLLYERGEMAVADVCEALPDQPSGSAVRTMLKRLEDKGYVHRHESDRGFIYRPVVADSVAPQIRLERSGAGVLQRLRGRGRDGVARHVGPPAARRPRRARADHRQGPCREGKK